ncbi:tetratricopeptide repeat protein [Paenalkalicoccus suaedae]|uniref:Tetratricopeptide repeat protein n=1 Tax=Paenalkalicoccus suaedae TaxID=2592382 RepID=A0A859FJ58_9BACI|nr:stalk domain-containing protein [Paenalkalicoccus suaedae]QKS72465.1 tetratricopeptide repeat protein [Paenalkalicoccus suaedae]
MKRRIIIFLALLLVLPILTLPQTAEASSWPHVSQGNNALKAGQYSQAVTHFERALRIDQHASTYRSLGQAHEGLGNYQKAADAYYKSADVFQRMGDINTYNAVKNLADELNTEIGLYVTETGQATSGSALYEPSSGMYFGAYIEADQIRNVQGTHYNDFNYMMNKQHSMYFDYHRYGDGFPKQFAERVKAQGGAIQIALEPLQGLNAVKDDAYLRQFARDAKAAEVPVFLRFASEFNGSWVPWHGNPQQYINSFRLVSRVMSEEAPNVAMVWSPSASPAHSMHEYYPGDAAVDWVGINVYSTPYLNGNANQPAIRRDPLDRIDIIYDTYAHRKPMMIAEFAASHHTSVGNQDMTRFGQMRLKSFYQGLKLRYPNVKAVNWFSVDTFSARNVPNERRLNNYSLTVNQAIINTYRRVIADEYFLTDVVNGPHAKEETASPFVSALDGTIVHDTITVSTHAKTYDPYVSRVAYRLNGGDLSSTTTYPYNIDIRRGHLRDGANTLEAIVFDSQGRVAGRERATITRGQDRATFRDDQLVLYVGSDRAYTGKTTSQLLQKPFVRNGSTLVPLRFISESFGANVTWKQADRSITIELGEDTIRLTEGSIYGRVNGTQKTLRQAPVIVNGVTFVPIRFVSEELGAVVQFEAPRTVNIFK